LLENLLFMHDFHMALVYSRLQHHGLDVGLLRHLMSHRHGDLMLRSCGLDWAYSREVFAAKGALLEDALVVLRSRLSSCCNREVLATESHVRGHARREFAP